MERDCVVSCNDHYLHWCSTRYVFCASCTCTIFICWFGSGNNKKKYTTNESNSCWIVDSVVLILSYRFSVLLVYYLQMDNGVLFMFPFTNVCVSVSVWKRSVFFVCFYCCFCNRNLYAIGNNEQILANDQHIFCRFPSLSHPMMCAVYLPPKPTTRAL